MATNTASKKKTAAAKKDPHELPYIVALDIGFGGSKGVSSFTGFEDTVYIPSTVKAGKKINSKLLRLSKIEHDTLVVSTDDGTFHVGKQAMKMNKEDVSTRTLERDRAEDPVFRTLFRTMMGLLLPNTEEEMEVFVITGLPNTDYDKNIKDKLEEFINQTHEVEYHLSENKSIIKRIKVTGSVVIRQPEGAITFNHFKFIDGILSKSQNYREFVGLIDIGHYTTDYALFDEGVIIENENTFGSTLATHDAYRKLKVMLSKKFAEMGHTYEAPDEDLDRAFREKKIYFFGEQDVSEEVAIAAADTAEAIAKEVLDSWKQHANRLHAIILSGGGANVFADALRKEFAERNVQDFIVIDNPQFSNVFGYLIFGILELEDLYGEDLVREIFIKPLFGA